MWPDLSTHKTSPLREKSLLLSKTIWRNAVQPEAPPCAERPRHTFSRSDIFQMAPVLNLLRRNDTDDGSWRDHASDEDFILEAWSQGFMAGALVIMACITVSNMRRGVLLHKFILVEVRTTRSPPKTSDEADIWISNSQRSPMVRFALWHSTATVGIYLQPPLSSTAPGSSTTWSPG